MIPLTRLFIPSRKGIYNILILKLDWYNSRFTFPLLLFTNFISDYLFNVKLCCKLTYDMLIAFSLRYMIYLAHIMNWHFIIDCSIVLFFWKFTCINTNTLSLIQLFLFLSLSLYNIAYFHIWKFALNWIFQLFPFLFKYINTVEDFSWREDCKLKMFILINWYHLEKCLKNKVHLTNALSKFVLYSQDIWNQI